MTIQSSSILTMTLLLLLTLFITPTSSNNEIGDMTYISLPTPTTPSSSPPGGYCLDGSRAGYYLRPGPNPSLFIIHLRGGGGCSTEEDCLARNGTYKGSSLLWEETIVGDRMLDGNCEKNPEFCEGMGVHVPYCTGDAHMGNNTEKSDSTWGLYFDGHANFVSIIEHLIQNYGLGDASHVVLTGGSAGSVGVYFNVDWLANRLGDGVVVKGVPNAGWYNPGSLPNDLDEIYAPSDYQRFVNGEKGNLFYDQFQLLNGTVAADVRKLKEGVLSRDCLDDYEEEEWWACASLHVAYRYIQTPLFNIHSQYDSNQIFSTQGFAPKNPQDESEIQSVSSYIAMWGKATRTSLTQILNNATLTTTKTPPGDGLFSTSCLSHGTFGTTIGGRAWLPIVRDWFFERGELTNYYRLMETCEIPDGYLELPCNEAKHCRYEPQNVPDDDDDYIDDDECVQDDNAKLVEMVSKTNPDLNVKSCGDVVSACEEDTQRGRWLRQVCCQTCSTDDDGGAPTPPVTTPTPPAPTPTAPAPTPTAPAPTPTPPVPTPTAPAPTPTASAPTPNASAPTPTPPAPTPTAPAPTPTAPEPTSTESSSEDQKSDDINPSQNEEEEQPNVLLGLEKEDMIFIIVGSVVGVLFLSGVVWFVMRGRSHGLS